MRGDTRSVVPFRRPGDFIKAVSVVEVGGRKLRVEVECGPAAPDEVPLPPGYTVKSVLVTPAAFASRVV